MSKHTPAIQALQADLRSYSRAGHSCQDYDEDHIITALIAADIDIPSLGLSPVELYTLALMDLYNKALEQ